MIPTMLFAQVAGVIVLVQSEAPPAPEDWQAFLEFVGGSRVHRIEQKVLVITPSKPPSLQQQRGLNELISGLTVRVAIVSESQEVQRAVRMLRMHNPGTHAFTNAALSEALNYLEVPPEQHDEVFTAIAEFQSRIAPVQT